MDDKQEQKKHELFYGSIMFGSTLPIGLWIFIQVGHFDFQIEHSSLAIDILLWILDFILGWMFRLLGIFLPWIAWKKLVEPYKYF